MEWRLRPCMPCNGAMVVLAAASGLGKSCATSGRLEPSSWSGAEPLTRAKTDVVGLLHLGGCGLRVGEARRPTQGRRQLPWPTSPR